MLFCTEGVSVESPESQPMSAFFSLEERVKGQPLYNPNLDLKDYPDNDPGPVINEAMKETLRAVFSQEGSYAQQLLVNEMVTAVETMSLSALVELFRMVLGSISEFLAIDPLKDRDVRGGLAVAMRPFMATMQTVSSMVSAPVGELNDEDKHMLSNAKAILEMMEPKSRRGKTPFRVLSAAKDIIPLVPELFPGLFSTLVMCTQEFTRRKALRLAEDLNFQKMNEL